MSGQRLRRVADRDDISVPKKEIKEEETCLAQRVV